jgi:hypothetical protein
MNRASCVALFFRALLHKSMRALFLFAVLFTFPSAAQDKQQLTNKDAPCFAEVTLVSNTQGGWLTLKRTNLDSCAFEPFDTSILVSGDLQPRILKTKKGWEITFMKSL